VTAEGVIAGMGGDNEASAAPASETALDDLVHLANEGPVVKLVNLILLEALEARASDVHVEGYADALRVRYRIDGVLQEGPAPPAHLKAAIVSRLKIMADLDIAERRVPQDGRIRLRLQDRQVDVRVSTVPVLHGESVVLRLLDKERARIALEDLGMSDRTAAEFAEAIRRPHGIVLSTGPTGSGKTTTLYAAIDQIRTGREKILTVEDPVEYELAGVPQVPVHEKVGLTFATALRSLLRQDPDVLLVGEIRDEATAAATSSISVSTTPPPTRSRVQSRLAVDSAEAVPATPSTPRMPARSSGRGKPVVSLVLVPTPRIPARSSGRGNESCSDPPYSDLSTPMPWLRYGMTGLACATGTSSAPNISASAPTIVALRNIRLLLRDASLWWALSRSERGAAGEIHPPTAHGSPSSTACHAARRVRRGASAPAQGAPARSQTRSPSRPRAAPGPVAILAPRCG